MIWVFWTALALLAYTVVGYPLLLWGISLFRRRSYRLAPCWPTISLIIAASNEAGQIEEKIRNSLALDYPEDKREILVASDGSTDATPELIRAFRDRGVKLIELPERRGKHFAQMLARDASRGEILVFSDAGVRLEPKTLERIASNFADPSVGCVSSEDHITPTAGTSLGEDSYVDFETWLRRLECRVNSLINLSGSLLAARREVCADWNPRQSSDFFLALNAAAMGLRAVVDPECRGWYGTSPSGKTEYRRKIRTIVHGLDVFFTHLSFLNPWRFGLLSWQLASHKLLRWLVPWLLLLVAVANGFLWNAGLFYRLCLGGQVFLYACAILGWTMPGLKRFRIFKLTSFFLLGNVAAAVAWMKYIGGERFASWKPTVR